MTEAPELREMDDPEGMAIHNATQMDDRDWQTKHAVEDEAAPAEPLGMIDHNCRIAIRELMALYGFETAREHIAFFLIDELNRSAS